MQLDCHANIQCIIISDCDHKIILAVSFLPFIRFFHSSPVFLPFGDDNDRVLIREIENL